MILASGLLTLGVTVYMVTITYSSLPFADGWTQISVVANGENALSPAWLWRQHNDHRIVIPKLFLTADLYLAHATQIVLLASIVVIQLLHWMALSWSMRALAGWHGALWRTGAGLAAFCLFCPTQDENFIWGFQVCFVLPGLFATLSFLGLLLCWVKRDGSGGLHQWKFLLLSILAAIGATYSLSNGNIIWPLLVCASLLLRVGLPAMLSCAITGAISTVLYWHGYVARVPVFSQISSLSTLLKLLKYMAVYFGSSWVRLDVGFPLGPSLLMGIAGLVFAFLVLCRIPIYVRTSDPFAVLLGFILLFCLGTGFVTSLGRLSLGYVQAFSSRYQTVALVLWCCLGLIVLRAVARSADMRVPFVVAQFCLLAILARGAILVEYPLRQARWHGFQMHATSMALLVGVNDLEQLHEAYPPTDYPLDIVSYMQDKRLSIFAGGVSAQLGKPLDSMFRVVTSQDCAGTLDSATTVDNVGSHLRITGWAWDYQHRRPASEIVATTNGIVSGLGAVGQRLPDRDANPWMTSSYVGFAGYIRDVQGSAPVEIYAVLSGSPPAACHFATIASGGRH